MAKVVAPYPLCYPNIEKINDQIALKEFCIFGAPLEFSPTALINFFTKIMIR